MLILKLLCAFLGYSMMGFWGALLGYFLGAVAEAVLSGRLLLTAGARSNRQTVFLETVFQLMGRLAKSDGRVSESEIKHTERFMDQLGMQSDRRREAIALFKQGTDANFDVEQALKRFKNTCGRSAHLSHLLMVYLLGVAVADGQLQSAEEVLLRKIGASLGMSSIALDRLIAMTRGQDQFGGGYHRTGSGAGARAPSSAESLSAAYQALGVQASDSDSVVKRAYRKLMSEFHPDKLIGQGVPEDMVRVATERSQEIQKAYDLIKKHRAK
ncbi:MAG: co-chaperone DjlA [Granulosicoccaceae bacterium]